MIFYFFTLAAYNGDGFYYIYIYTLLITWIFKLIPRLGRTCVCIHNNARAGCLNLMYYLQIEENVLERFTNGMLFDNAPALFYYYKTRKNTHTHTIRTVRLAVRTKTSTCNIFVHACLNGKKNVQSPQPAFSVHRTRKKNSVCAIIVVTRVRAQFGISVFTPNGQKRPFDWFTRIFFLVPCFVHNTWVSTYNTRIVIIMAIIYTTYAVINRDDSGFIINRYAIDWCMARGIHSSAKIDRGRTGRVSFFFFFCYHAKSAKTVVLHLL